MCQYVVLFSVPLFQEIQYFFKRHSAIYLPNPPCAMVSMSGSSQRENSMSSIVFVVPMPSSRFTD